VIEELAALELRPAVSLLMPTRRAGPESRQNPVRLRNLIKEAERRLEGRGLAAADVARTVGLAHALVDDEAFWLHQQDGLAVYAAPNFLRAYRIDQPLREMVVVSERFHLTQLLPVVTRDSRFYVLALSQKDVRLIEASRAAAAELDLGDLPRSLDAALAIDTPDKQLQHHVSTIVGGEHGAVFHGHGAGLLDRKEAIRQFFHVLDRGLRPFLADRHAPLVLAGVDYLLPLYRETNSHPRLLPEGLTGNLIALSPHELRARAWEIVEPHLDSTHAAALGRYHRLAGTGLASDDLGTVIAAAHDGRVDELFVAGNEEIWGTFEPGAAAVTVRDGPGAVTEELLNLAAILAVQRGGTVHVLDRGRVPGGGGIAAILRY
jgi:hypothetical protein